MKNKTKTDKKEPKSTVFLRCPACGRSSNESAFALGITGKHTIEILRRTYVGRGRGENGGAVIYSHEPLPDDDLRLIEKALINGLERIQERIQLRGLND